MRAHQNTWGRMSQAQKQVRKQNDGIPNFWFKWLIGMDADRSFMHVQWFSHQNDRADYHDITW